MWGCLSKLRLVVMTGVCPPEILAPGAAFEVAYVPLCFPAGPSSGQVVVKVFCQLGK